MTPFFEDIKDVREALQKPYDRQLWTGKILPGLFSRLALAANPTKIDVSSGHGKLFDEAHWLGSAKLVDADGRERRIWIAELILKEPDRLHARVKLREGLSKLLGGGEVEAVLALFVGGEEGYRATYASADWEWTEGKLVKKETPPKRFSFALGPSELTRTAALRLRWLSERRVWTRFEDVAEAFSVERLNKAFFEGYKQSYNTLCAALAKAATAKAFGLPGTNDAVAAASEAQYKPIRDFTKRMLGRIVFLKFVERKGWLGADPATLRDVYENGDRSFIQKIVGSRPNENPYAGPLATLFFGTLNMRRDGDICSLTGRKVPYLNSGLFDPEALNPRARKDPVEQHKSLAVPPEPLHDFLSFLDEFNFTVDENSPDDSEIGVDPEMLGHIFENLLEDNKEKGAFYTPKAVVAHMCKESLLLYLERRFGARKELLRLVRFHDVGDWNSDKNWVKKNAASIYEALQEVRVCDPACGSGAFPMGMLNELFWLRWTLHPVKEEELSDLRKSIIQSNLHGVDLDGAAVEIARLRFWLSIVVDSTRPEPLPNLDFRFLQGDSLVGFVGAESEWAKHFLSGEERKEGGQFELAGFTDRQAEDRREKFGRERKRIAELLEAHFGTTGPSKETYATEILAAERTFVVDVLKHAKDDLEKLKTSKKLRARIESLDERIKKLTSTPLGGDRDYFPWLFYEEGGFDIVIANPPYISAIDHKKTYGEEARNALKESYVTASGAFDVYVCFFELGANLLREGGALTFITPNRWLSVKYAEELRSFMATRMDLRSITDLSSVHVFKSVSVYPVISTLRKGVADRRGYVEIAVGTDAGEGDVRLEELPSAGDALLEALPGRIWGFLLDSRRLLLSQILKKSVWLSDKAQVNALTTAGEADGLGQILVENTRAPLRVINTGTIDPFVTLWGERALLKQGRKFLHAAFGGSNTAFENRKALFKTPKIVVAKMALRCEAFLDEKGAYAGIDVNTVYAPQPGYSLRFLIGYMHSDVAAFCHRLFFKGLTMSGGYLPFQAPHLRVLPIPDLEREGGRAIVRRIEKAVGRILDHGEAVERAMQDINEALSEFYDLGAGDLEAIADALGEHVEGEEQEAQE